MLTIDRAIQNWIIRAITRVAAILTNAHLLTPMLSPPRSVELRAGALLFVCRWEAA
jgi:hypothetical protein